MPFVLFTYMLFTYMDGPHSKLEAEIAAVAIVSFCK